MTRTRANLDLRQEIASAVRGQHEPARDLRLHGGFTVLEVTLVAALMSFLVILMSATWSGLGRATADVAAFSRIDQEATLALESLRRDFSGNLPELPAGSKYQGQLIGQRAVTASQLELCFDGDADRVADWSSPDVVVTYRVQSGRLLRETTQPWSQITVACYADAMTLTDQGDSIRVDVTFRYRNVAKTYTTITQDP
jgi:hypothetical protein